MPNCTKCNTPLSEETTGGLCPRCLLAMNLDPQTLPGTGASKDQLPPPTPEELASAFPGFEILECLGRGGMGIVYKARQKNLDRTVALKVLAGEWHGDPAFAERFAREARVLARLNHPNIVTIHDFGEAGDLFYLVMEYVDGANLREILRDGKIPPEQALQIVPPICEALQYAHDNGVVHRDIKPENLLLDRTGTVKIADFGIASLTGSTETVQGGTPEYMPPEKTADHRADIYSLGVVLYELLTGKRPSFPLQPPSKAVQVDVRIDDVVLRALEAEPEKRYQTAAQFRTAIETPAPDDPKPIRWKLYAIVYAFLTVLACLLEFLQHPSVIEIIILIGLVTWTIILWAKMLHRLWSALPEPYRATTPGKAVGLMFVPFFHIYWAFTAYGKYAKGISAYRRDQGKPLSENAAALHENFPRIALLCSISIIAMYTVSFIPYAGSILTGIFDVVVTTLFFRKAQQLTRAV